LQFTSTTIVPTTPTAVVPSYFTALQVVCDPRIGDSSWFLAASPLQIDTIEIARMASMPEEPDVAVRTGWEIDGMEFKGRIDRGAAAIEWRGLVMVPGV
jgi:hypothetical protein